jgi:hypothetical protein
VREPQPKEWNRNGVRHCPLLNLVEAAGMVWYEGLEREYRNSSGMATVKVESASNRFNLRQLWWGVGAGALAAAALVIILSWNLIATRNELHEAQNQLAALKTQVTQREEVLRLLSDPQVRIVNLAALPASPGASGQLLWKASSRTGMLLVSGLPPSPTGTAYELWGIAGAEPVPAGVFIVDAGGLAQVRLPKLPETKAFDKFAVTIEPAGGVPQPTGATVLLGSL